MFGGVTTSATLNDSWALSLGGTPAWSKPIADGPPPPRRESHSAILGPVRERVIVFGGSGEGSLLNDIWELPLTGEPVWQPMVAYGNPLSPRSGPWRAGGGGGPGAGTPGYAFNPSTPFSQRTSGSIVRKSAVSRLVSRPLVT